MDLFTVVSRRLYPTTYLFSVWFCVFPFVYSCVFDGWLKFRDERHNLLTREEIMKSRILPVLSVVVLLLGCSKDSPIESNSPTGSGLDKLEATVSVFQYTGYSSNGTAIVRGFLSLTFTEAGRVSGRWQLRALVDPSRIGPQVGTGSLVGGYSNGVLSINLNPNNVDNNVLLSGRFDRTAYAGRWEWVGFPGVLSSGTFRAARSVIEASAGTD